MKIPVRVYYQDTDAGGVVYHAQYFSFMERARTEMLNEAGVDLARMADKLRLLFFVFEINARYHLPARLNDMLSVSAEVVKMRRASLVFRHRVERAAEPKEHASVLPKEHASVLLVEAEVTLALVNRDTMKPARMPQEIEQAFK